MRTFRIIGIVGGVAALLLSANLAFARQPATSTPRMNPGGERRAMIASTTTRMQLERERMASTTAAREQKVEERLTAIQDKAKQQMAQRLTTQFNTINTQWTDHFTNLLNRYDAILQKIQTRANAAAAAGKNVASTTAAIQSAQTAIANARTAVAAQAAKDYTPDTSVASTTATTATTTSDQEGMLKALRGSFQSIHSTLFKDLFTLRDGPMLTARRAVQAALQTLSAIPGIDEVNATSTEN